MPSDSSAWAREQHLGVSMTTGITMNSDFAPTGSTESLWCCLWKEGHLSEEKWEMFT